MNSNSDETRNEQSDRREEILFEMYPLGFDRTEDGFILEKIDQSIVVECPRLNVHFR